MKGFLKILFVVLLAMAPLMVQAQTSETHTVQRGETFALIAKRYGLTEQELKNANPDEDLCYAGLKLSIPAKPKPEVTVSDYTSSSVEDSQPSQNYSDNNTDKPKKKKSFWKKLGTGALVVAGVAAGVAMGVASAKAGEGGTTAGSSYGGDYSGYDDSSPTVASGKSLSYYQTTYDKWASKAEKTYKDGVKHKGQSKSGDRGSGRIATAEARLLRTQQKGMRQTRQQAQKEGYSLNTSIYETISF